MRHKIIQIPDSYNGIMIVGEAPGCFLKHTPIFTEYGVSNIEDTLSSYNITDDNLIVADLSHNVVEYDIVDFKAAKFPNYSATANHKILIRYRHLYKKNALPQGLSDFCWASLYDINNMIKAGVQCFTVVPKVINESKHNKLLHIKKYNRPNDLTLPDFIELDEDLALFFGLFEGDGNVNFDNGMVRLYLHKTKDFEANFIGNVIASRFNLRPHFYQKQNVTIVALNSRTLCSFFIDLFGKVPYKKNIPREIFESPPNVISKFLYGWYLADGSKNKNLTKAQSIDGINKKAIYDGCLLGLKCDVLLGISNYTSRKQNEQEVFSLNFDTRSLNKLNWPIAINERESPNYYEDDKYYLLRITETQQRKFSGIVYDKETSKHFYTIPFIVHNSEETTSVRYNEKYDAYIGKPFIGTEGQYLRTSCRAVNFPFNDCIVTNTVHTQPLRNWYDNLSKETIEEGVQALASDIEKFKPKLIIAIGAKALEHLTGQTQIIKFRGSVLPCTLVSGYKVFATIHPGFIFRGNPQYDVVLKVDLRKAMGEVFPEIIEPERNIRIITDYSEALKTLYDLCYHKQHVAVDIETGGPRLLSFGVATSTSEAIVIPKELLKEVEVLKAVSEFCESDTPKIYHNGLYDVFYLAYHYKIFTKNIAFDTMIAQHAIFPTLPKSLAFCSSLYTKQPYWKDEGKEVTKDYAPNKIINWHDFYIYNGKDCCVTYEIFEKQQEELDYWNVREIFNLMMRSVDYALLSQMTGLDIDWAEKQKFEEANEKALVVLNRIKEACIGDINLNSSQQVGKLLYEDWRLPERKKKGKRTVDDDALTSLEILPTNVQHFCGLIKKVKKHTKLRAFYNIRTAEDGKLHWSNKITGTITGRWSTSQDIVTSSGLNIQNQPPAVRVLYKAPKGKLFLEWDLSNVDARFVAALCDDEDWLRAFDIIDQHSFTAVNLFKLEPFYSKMHILDLSPQSLKKFKAENSDFLSAMLKKVKEDYTGGKSRRDYSKRAGHATHYLEGPHKLALQLGCSSKEATQHIKEYKILRPKLEAWHNRVRDEVGKTRVIRTCFNRVIQFFGPQFNEQLPNAVAAEPQSCAGDYLMTGGLKCLDQIPELRFNFQVHDSINTTVDDDVELLKTIMPKIKSIAEFPVVVRGLEFKVPIEFKIGYNWGKMIEIKNLNKIDETYRKVNS